jgi:hypothetical protein
MICRSSLGRSTSLGQERGGSMSAWYCWGPSGTREPVGCSFKMWPAQGVSCPLIL